MNGHEDFFSTAINKIVARFAGTCYKYVGGADDLEIALLPSSVLFGPFEPHSKVADDPGE
jgi:hypothetical protein